MKSRLNMFILIGVVVFLLLIAASGYLLYRGFANLQGSEARLQERRAVFAQFFDKNPFPSPENVAREKENVRKLNGLYEALLADLSKEQILPAGLSPSTFMGVLGEKRNKLAAEAKASGTGLAADFGFGFEKYLEKGSNLPAPEHVPRLTQQLMIVEHLCAILCSERIRELSVLKREEFEGAVVGAGAPPPTVLRRLNSAARSADEMSRIARAGVMGSNDLYTAFHFTLAFKAGEKSLVSILNRVASGGMFIIVRKIDVTKDLPDVNEASVASAPGPAEAAKVAGARAVGPRELSRQARMACGIGREVALNVVMELEAYRFREPAQEK
jgi:hypothetical protein